MQFLRLVARICTHRYEIPQSLVVPYQRVGPASGLTQSALVAAGLEIGK